MHYIRGEMVDALARGGISSSDVLDVLSRVPRHLFVSEALRYQAYRDISLPIGFGQTISKP
jgi:protein-L-isoaspartate(D-aspartate) O-methyltransferase